MLTHYGKLFNLNKCIWYNKKEGRYFFVTLRNKDRLTNSQVKSIHDNISSDAVEELFECGYIHKREKYFYKATEAFNELIKNMERITNQDNEIWIQ